MAEHEESKKSQGHVRPHPEEPKRRVGEHPEPAEEKGLPIGNGGTGEPAVFPPHN